MKKFIYQDPRRPRFKSRPIDEDDITARQILEGGGWKICETIDDSAPAVAEAGEAISVETAAAPSGEAAAPAGPKEPKKGKGKKAPAGPEEPKA